MIDNPFASIGVSPNPTSGGSSPIPENPFASIGQNPIIQKVEEMVSNPFENIGVPKPAIPLVPKAPVASPYVPKPVEPVSNPFEKIGVSQPKNTLLHHISSSLSDAFDSLKSHFTDSLKTNKNQQVFNVGEGLTPEETENAQKYVTSKPYAGEPKIPIGTAMTYLGLGLGGPYKGPLTPEDRKAAFDALQNPVLGVTGGDLSGAIGGKVTNAALEHLAQEGDAIKISDALVKVYKVPRDVADEVAGPLAQAKTPDEVKNVLLGREMPDTGPIHVNAEVVGVPKELPGSIETNTKVSTEKVAGGKLEPDSYAPIEKNVDESVLPDILKPYSGNVVENQGGNTSILADLPTSLFKSVKFTTLNQPAKDFKPGSDITDPIEVTYDIATKKYTITDGANRTTQALKNGDQTIPAVVEVIDSKNGYESLLDKINPEVNNTVYESKAQKTGDGEPQIGDTATAPEINKQGDIGRENGFDQKSQKYIDIRGKQVNSSSDLASLLKDYRNPRKEILHVVYLDDAGKVVGHSAFTMDEHAMASFPKSEVPFKINQRAQRLGATQTYFAHNHPSGNPTASDADIQMTQKLNRVVPTFKGHIVLDHNRFTEISGLGHTKEKPVDLGLSYESKGNEINTTKDAIELMRSHYKFEPGRVGIVVLNPQLKPIAIENIKYNQSTFEDTLQQIMRKHRGNDAVLGVEKDVHDSLVNRVHKNPYIMEVVTKNDSGDLSTLTSYDRSKIRGSWDDIDENKPISRLFEQPKEFNAVPNSKDIVKIDLLHRQLQRTADSLRDALEHPEAHLKAYPGKTPAVYRARIDELNAKLDKLMPKGGANSQETQVGKTAKLPTEKNLQSREIRANQNVLESEGRLAPQYGEQEATAMQERQQVNSSYDKTLQKPNNSVKSIPVKNSDIPVELVEKQIDIEQRKEAIQSSPYKQLLKYISKSGEFQGHLPEVTGKKGASEFARRGDTIIQEIFGAGDTYAQAPDVEEIRAGMDKYLDDRKRLYREIKDLKKDVASFKAARRKEIQDERDQAFLDEEARKQARPLAQVMDEIEPPVGRGGIQPPKLDFTKWKDKGFLGTLRLGRETLDRNIMDVMPAEQAEKVKKFLTDPIRKNETERTEFVNNMRADVKAKMKEIGIKPRSKADELIQKVGEGRVNQEQVTKEAPTQAKAIIDGVTYFRKVYDDLLDTWNAKRVEFGYKPVPKREDYFRHFQEIADVFQQVGAIGRGQDLPTEIAGITHIFKPGKAYSNAENHRTGDNTVYSAMAGMDNYLDTVSKQIWSMDSIARADTLLTYIRDAARETAKYVPEERVEIPRIAENIQGVLDQLRYKKSTVDTGMQSVLGRGVYASAQLVKNRVAANMVGANIASALTNLIPVLTQLPSTTGPKYTLQGLYEGIGAPLMKDPAMIDGIRSDFLRRRYPADNIAPTNTQKAINFVGIVFKAVDEFAGYSIVSAKYHENVAKGMSKTEAMKNADEYAAKVIADRSLAQTPNLFSHKTLGFFTQFQLETNNLYSFLKKDIPEMSGHNGYKIFKKLLAFAVASYVFNELYKKATGRRPTFDPIYDVLTLSGIQTGTKDLTIKQRASIVGKDLAGNIPFGNIIPGIDSGRLPVSAVLPKNFTPLELSRVALSILPPAGGGQIFKTLKGAITYRKGYNTTTAGNPSFAIEKNTENLIRELIFGPSSTSEATDYYKNLNAGPAKDSKIQAIYEQVKALDAAGKTAEADKIMEENFPDTPEGDAAYKEYQSIKTSDKNTQAKGNTEKYLTEVLDSGIVQKVRALDAAGKTAEADKLLNDMFPDTPEGDAKYDAYKQAKKLIPEPKPSVPKKKQPKQNPANEGAAFKNFMAHQK